MPYEEQHLDARHDCIGKPGLVQWTLPEERRNLAIIRVFCRGIPRQGERYCLYFVDSIGGVRTTILFAD